MYVGTFQLPFQVLCRVTPNLLLMVLFLIYLQLLSSVNSLDFYLFNVDLITLKLWTYTNIFESLHIDALTVYGVTGNNILILYKLVCKLPSPPCSTGCRREKCVWMCLKFNACVRSVGNVWRSWLAARLVVVVSLGARRCRVGSETSIMKTFLSGK